MAVSELARQILATIAYCDQFQYPLTKAEILTRLIGQTQPTHFDATLTQLVSTGTVQEQDDFYFLKGSVSHVTTRKTRALTSSLKWAEAKSVVNALHWIPWIAGIAITGSLAMNNASVDDDIDFMIITRDNRLWLTRPLVIAYAWWHGKRRSWQKEEPNSWCFNLWLEESELHSPGLKQSLYTAYEVCQAKFLLSHDRVEPRFIWANHWVTQYLPFYFTARCEETVTDTQPLVKNFGRGALDYLGSWIFFLTNEVLFWLQWIYMARHRTREVVTRTKAYFHPRERQYDHSFRDFN